MESSQLTVVGNVSKLYGKVVRYGLVGADYLATLTLGEMGAAYNGVGPAKWPELVRDALSRLNRVLLPMVLVHDCMFEYFEKTCAAFDTANSALRANGRIIADAEYAWYNPMRYYVRYKAAAFAALCEKFGWEAFVGKSS